MQGRVTSINQRALTKLRRAAVVRDAIIGNRLCTLIFGRYSQASDTPAVPAVLY